MKTTKPFSTISYNTEQFLTLKLDRLVKHQELLFYCFIRHIPESDEKKSHIHLYMEPNGQFDTDRLRDYLMECDMSSPGSAPLGIMPVCKSNFADWYLYCLHDNDYLLSKGQSREFHYTDDNIISSCIEYFLECKHKIDFTKYTKTKKIVDMLLDGKSAIELVSNGVISLNQFNSVQKIQDAIMYNLSNQTFRDDKSTHTPVGFLGNKMISDDGEIINEITNDPPVFL